MKYSLKKSTLLLGILALGFSSCNNEEYSPLGASAFISESATSSSRSTKVTITEQGADAQFTVCLSEAVNHDVKLHLKVDEEALKAYNKAQATSFVMLPEGAYEIEKEIVIKAGEFAAPATRIHILPLTDELIGESYAIPVRLVSDDAKVPAMSMTAEYVITTEAVTTSSYPMFTGQAGLSVENFKANYPQFTIECRFQISDTGNRNRAVFTNGGSVLLRFEDPQQTQNGIPQHSLVQFQGEGWYLNPSDYFRIDKWQHLALVYDGKCVKLYVNGSFAGTKDGTCAPEFNGCAWFGGDAGGGHGTGDPRWWGRCNIIPSELRIWSVARTEAQIQNNITTTSSRSEGLEAYWRMSKSTCTQEGEFYCFTDVSGNGHVLKTKVPMTWIDNVKSSDSATPWP